MSERYSYSKLDLYKQCPFRFYLNYVLGNYAYTDSIATEFGTAIHECEEAIAKSLQANENVNYIKLKNEFILKTVQLQKKYGTEFYENDGKSDRNYAMKSYEYLTKDIYNLEKFMKDHSELEIVGIEQKFNFSYSDNYVFSGAIDRVFHNKDTNAYIIQDIKSWAIPKEAGDLATPLQFVVYTLAAKQLWGAEPEQVTCEYYLPLVENGLTQSAGTKNFIDRGIKKIEELFASIENNDFKPHKSPLCNYCPFSKTNPDAQYKFKYLCPYHSLWNRDTRSKFDINKSEYEWQGLEEHTKLLEEYCTKNNFKIID